MIPHFLSGKDECNELLSSIQAQDADVDLKVVLVGNNPRLAVPVVEIESSNVLVHDLGVNLGYAGSIEYARRRYSSDYIWILQEDNFAESNCLRNLLRSFADDTADPPLALVTPTTKRSSKSDRISVRNFATGEEITLFNPEEALSSLRNAVHINNIFSYVPISGALVKSSSMASVGGLDTRLWPLGSVDADFCARLQISGFGIAKARDAQFRHSKGFGRYDSFPFWKAIAKKRNRDFVTWKFSVSPEDRWSHDGNQIPQDLLFNAMLGQTSFLVSYSDWVAGYKTRREANLSGFFGKVRTLLRNGRSAS